MGRIFMKISDTVMEMAERLAEKQDVYVVDTEYKKEGRDWFLRVFIDKNGGVGIDECETFSRAFEKILDEADIIKEPYCLEVSSPGADRKLVKQREFEYYMGRKVDIKLYKAMENGEKEFSGILKGFENKKAFIETPHGDVDVLQSDAVWIRLHFEF